MIKFYDVDKNYINFLKTIDSQIPNIEYEGNNKFVCGIVLTISNINYYAPISHMTNRQRTNIQITENGRVLSTIRFSFMFPAMKNVLTVKDFSVIAQNNQQYADLLNAEYRFCRAHEAEICNKALQVYRIGCNKNHVLNYTCCDFKKLEEHYLEYATQETRTSNRID